MLDQIRNRLKEVENSESYKRYIKENPEAYFVSAFIMGNFDQIDGNWTIDYYSDTKHKIMTFSEKGAEEGDILQKDFVKLERLDLEEVKIDLDEAFQKLKDLFAEKYAGINWGKSIIVLQQKNEPIWNITLTTGTLEIFNAKISAVTGEIKSEKMEKLIKL